PRRLLGPAPPAQSVGQLRAGPRGPREQPQADRLRLRLRVGVGARSPGAGLLGAGGGPPPSRPAAPAASAARAPRRGAPSAVTPRPRPAVPIYAGLLLPDAGLRLPGIGRVVRAVSRAGRVGSVQAGHHPVTSRRRAQTSPGRGTAALAPRPVTGVAEAEEAAAPEAPEEVSRRGPMPSFSLIFFSISSAMSGLFLRKFRAFSLPWPSCSPS